MKYAIRVAGFSPSLLPGVVVLSATFTFFAAGCGHKETGKDDNDSAVGQTTHIYQDQEPFKDWVRDRYQNIVVIHPLEHPHKDKFGEFAKIFSSLARQTCVFLRIEPQDSIIIYFYTGIGHGYSVTQQEAPFSDGYVIHFWFPSFYGPPIVKHLLPKWHKETPAHKFLRDGIIALLDGSGQNYHEMTLKLIDSAKFISLKDLSEDTLINVDRERFQSAEAASFVDFLVYAYDITRFKELYISNGDFSTDVKRIFGATVPEMEIRWINFLKTFAVKKTGVQD
jgi:hypothetical protein